MKTKRVREEYTLTSRSEGDGWGGRYYFRKIGRRIWFSGQYDGPFALKRIIKIRTNTTDRGNVRNKE
jgi:hypothetical protein